MKYLKALIAVAILVGFDQWTKWMAVIHLKGQAPIPIIKDVFELSYLQNQGAAFGILQGQKVYFIITTTVIVALIAWVYSRIPETKKHLPLKVLSVILTAGALGNFVDRLMQGYVVDFLYFKLIDFPTFNVADMYIVVSAFVLAFLVIFYYKDEKDLNFLQLRRKKNVPDNPGQADKKNTAQNQDLTGDIHDSN